jgi:tetratricopeptide (TPR) repeat protein
MFYRYAFLLAASVSLISASVWADENVPAPETPPADVSVPVQKSAESVPTPPPIIENEAPSFKTTRAKLAPQKIELFRATIKDTTQEKGVFSRMFSADGNPIDTELLADMRQFTEMHAGLPQTDEVLYLKSAVHQRIKNYPAAALDLIMLKVMYPQSSFVPAANKQLRELSADQLEKVAAVITKLNQKADSLNGDMDQRTGEFLEFLGTFREEIFAAPIVAECASFLAWNETFQNEDVIENAIAHQSMLLDNETALYHFNKLLALYSASHLRADSLLSIASIQRGKLKLYDKAAKTYLILIDKHPDSNEAKSGYESLAAMYNEDMRDYPNAIKTYDAIVARYKNDPIVLRGLLMLEKVYETKTNQPQKAIDTYLKLADVFGTGQDGLNALLAAEKIAVYSTPHLQRRMPVILLAAEKTAVYSTRNWVSAIEINERIMARSPNSEDAVKAVFSNADITENKLGDKGKAKELYEKFIAEHPKHSLAKDAKKRIDAMLKK